MNAKLIGMGAAGNKAVIELIEKGVVAKKDVLLLNSTLKDIPAGYKDLAIQFSGASGGCGKERGIAKKLVLESLQNKTIDLDNFLDPDDKMVILVNSSEGGTGCGASAIIAKYFKEVLSKNVHMFVFTGFEEDGRGLQNTVEYFSELSDKYTVQAISNKKFLDICNGNKLKAEKAANVEFARRIKILLGQMIVDSEQNIDETDLYKLTTTPGFMMIEFGELDKIKNVEAFNKAVANIIDNSKSLDIEPSAKRLGVILNISSKTKDNIDYHFSVIRDKLGVPYEMYTHVQTEQEPEYIAIIASGIKMPVNDVKAIYERYKTASTNVNKAKDSFFDITSDLVSNNEDSMFNMGEPDKEVTTENKKNFFSSLISVSSENPNSKFNNIKKNEEAIAKY